MKVENKVMVVTGGGSGIRRALVLKLGCKGARVAAVDKNEETLCETRDMAGEYKDRISLHVLNVSDHSAVSSLPERVIESHGAVDGLINNAGIIQPFVRFNDLEFEAIELVLDYNLYGQIYMTKAFLPLLLERPEAHIVNVSSMGGFFPVPGQTLYGASKAAVKLLTEGLYAELIGTTVAVSVVFPGAVDTNIAQNSGVAIEVQDDERAQDFSPLSPEVAAETIIDGMEHDKFQIYIGRDASMMNILYRINPRWATNFMFKQMEALLPD
jgi:short-subunit dehydrogenase